MAFLLFTTGTLLHDIRRAKEGRPGLTSFQNEWVVQCGKSAETSKSQLLDGGLVYIFEAFHYHLLHGSESYSTLPYMAALHHRLT